MNRIYAYVLGWVFVVGCAGQQLTPKEKEVAKEALSFVQVMCLIGNSGLAGPEAMKLCQVEEKFAPDAEKLLAQPVLAAARMAAKAPGSASAVPPPPPAPPGPPAASLAAPAASSSAAPKASSTPAKAPKK